MIILGWTDFPGEDEEREKERDGEEDGGDKIPQGINNGTSADDPWILFL